MTDKMMTAYEDLQLNAGAGESLAMVYFDGPVDFVLAE